MDHRVRVASIVFWSLFFINFLAAIYVITQFTTNQELFGTIPMIFLAVVNSIVCIIAGIGMHMHESYRL